MKNRNKKKNHLILITNAVIKYNKIIIQTTMFMNTFFDYFTIDIITMNENNIKLYYVEYVELL